MKKFSSTVALRAAVAMSAILATGVVTASAFAQPPAGGGAGGGGGFGGGGGRGGQRGGRGGMQITAAQIPSGVLAKELKLTDDQKVKIETAQKPLQTMMDDMAKANAAGTRPDRETMQKMMTARTDAETAIMAVLTDTQKDDLKTLTKKLTSLQQAGIPVGVYGDLKLTDDQVTQIQDISTKSQRKMRDDVAALGENPDRQAMMDVYQKGQADTKVKIDAVLSEDQRKALADYIKAHPMRGGFGGPGGGGGGRRGGGGAPAGGNL